MRVDLTDWDGNHAYAKYSIFSVGNESSNFRLTVGGYSGNAGNITLMYLEKYLKTVCPNAHYGCFKIRVLFSNKYNICMTYKSN